MLKTKNFGKGLGATTKTEETYLAHTRREDFQNQLRNPSIISTIIDIAMSAEYKKEVHSIYTACGLYPAEIGNQKNGIAFSTPHIFYERFTESSWKKKFSKAERQAFEAALQ